MNSPAGKPRSRGPALPKLGSPSIIVRMSAIRTLAVGATDNGLLAPALAVGIRRVKNAKSIGVRAGNWLSLKQAQTPLNAPDITTLHGHRNRAVIGRASEKVVWQMLRPYASAAGVAGIAPHDCRRTAAKLCRAAGGDLEQIQLLLGHASATDRDPPNLLLTGIWQPNVFRYN